ncbi:MAG TPA: hypothetical protein VF627_10000 [Abditibacterium sp.]|jgi:hypothetical protein
MRYLALLAAVSALTAPVLAAPTDVVAPTSIGFAGAVPDLSGVNLETRHVFDYTFTTAPTDWKIASGVWEMTNRWSCSPGWSWFGGRSDETAAIWNKRKLMGNQSAQVYFAFKMGMSGVAQWPEYPADVAVTICGDGKNLGSGYAFIAGAEDNTRSILMKNGRIVAFSSAPDAILPRLTDGRPGNEDIHRRWWFARVDKSGGKISCYVDDKLVLTYDDAAPLQGGQTAIWTYNNGLMLARVQLYYQQENRPVYVKSTAKSPIATTLAANKAKAKSASSAARVKLARL